MTTHHGFGPELGRKPITYTCVCGYRSTDYGDVGLHITDEQARAHAPRHLTTIPVVGGKELEIASTPYGDDDNAVEIRMTIPDGGDGRYRRYIALVRRADIPFLIEELEAHRLCKSTPGEPSS